MVLRHASLPDCSYYCRPLSATVVHDVLYAVAHQLLRRLSRLSLAGCTVLPFDLPGRHFRFGFLRAAFGLISRRHRQQGRKHVTTPTLYHQKPDIGTQFQVFVSGETSSRPGSTTTMCPCVIHATFFVLALIMVQLCFTAAHDLKGASAGTDVD